MRECSSHSLSLLVYFSTTRDQNCLLHVTSHKSWHIKCINEGPRVDSAVQTLWNTVCTTNVEQCLWQWKVVIRVTILGLFESFVCGHEGSDYSSHITHMTWVWHKSRRGKSPSDVCCVLYVSMLRWTGVVCSPFCEALCNTNKHVSYVVFLKKQTKSIINKV